jgi:hypothetical protein
MAKVKSRANGDGDVWPRKNKAGKITSYRGAYVGPDGKRRYVSGKTKEEARRNKRKAEAGAAGGVVLDAGKLTVGEYLERWLSDCLQPLVNSGKMEHSTFVRYEGIVDKHISPVLGRKKLRDLSRAEVRALYSAKGKKLSPRSVDYIHVTLQKALTQAISSLATSPRASVRVAAATGKRSKLYPPSKRGRCFQPRGIPATKPSTSWPSTRA